MKLLEAINKILPFLGEDMVSSIDESFNPTVSAIKTRILSAARGMLSKGMWFNTRTLSFSPDSNGRIQLPESILVLYSTDGRLLERRGGYLFDMALSTYVFSEPVSLLIHELLDFEDLPEVVCEAATWAGGLLAYTPEAGADSTASEMQMNMQAALAAVNREHLRKMQFNTQKQGAACRLRRSIGGLYARR